MAVLCHTLSRHVGSFVALTYETLEALFKRFQLVGLPRNRELFEGRMDDGSAGCSTEPIYESCLHLTMGARYIRR